MRPGEAPRLTCYWRLDAETCATLSRGHGYQDQVARLRALLERAAREQMVSDVPLGAFLSGGVDSTALVALMTRAAGRPIHTYSVGFPDAGAEIDESGDAERSAGYLGSVHRSVPVRGQDVAAALPRIAADLGQPTVDGVNMHFVSGAARSGVTVALTGMGGDELFAGYSTFPVLAGFNHPSARARRALRRALGAARRWLNTGTAIDRAWERRVMDHGFPAAYMTFRMLRAPCVAWRMAARPAIDAEAVLAYTDADDASLDDPVRRVTALESKLYMSSQLLRDTDAASMAHSLEVRVPLLDVEVSEYAYGLPAESKLRLGAPRGSLTGKRVLIDAVRDVIPEWVWRKPKRGFSMPFGEWLRGPVRELAEETLRDREFRQQGWIDDREAEREWRRFLDDRTAHWGGVWTVMMLALWWRHGLRGTAARPGRAGGGMAQSMTMQGAH
jgi:asparagine synthase (glutamine-hydrolysing)